MATKKINKIQLSTKNRVQRRFGPIVSEDIYNTIYEIINDIQSFRIQWNNIIYPLISSLPNQLNQYSPRLNESIIDPVLNGFDGTQVFVDRLTNLNKDNGKYYNTLVTPNRPNTIKEQFDWTYKYIDTKIEKITDLFGEVDIPDEVKERIGINAWNPTQPSRGTIYLGPNNESIDARSLNNKADIYQILSDVFGVDPNTKIGDVISATDYQISTSHPGVRTLKKTIRERLIGLEKIHSITDEQENKKPNHCHLLLFDDESYTASNAINKLTIDAKTESGIFKTIFHIQGTQYDSELTIKHSGGDNVSYDVLKIKKDTTTHKPLFLVDGYIKTTNEYLLLNNKESTPTKSGLLIYRGTSNENAQLVWDESSSRWVVYDISYGVYRKICLEGECGGGSGGSTDIPELFRYSRTLFGVAGDTVIEIDSSGEQHIMTGTLQDGAHDNLPPSIGWDRKYRLQIQYSDNFETIDSSINATLKITLLDTLDVYTITLPQCQNLDSLDSHILHITDLLDIDFPNHDFEITLEINNFQSGAIFNLYKLELLAYDVPQSGSPSTTWNTSTTTATSWNTTRSTSNVAQTQTSRSTTTTWDTISNYATSWNTNWNTATSTTTTWNTSSGSNWQTTWQTSSHTNTSYITSWNTATIWGTYQQTSKTTDSAWNTQTLTTWVTSHDTSSTTQTSTNTTINTIASTNISTVTSSNTSASQNTSRSTTTTWNTTWNTSSSTVTVIGQTVRYNTALGTFETVDILTATSTTWQTSSETSRSTTTSWNTSWLTTTTWNTLTSWDTSKTTNIATSWDTTTTWVTNQTYAQYTDTQTSQQTTTVYNTYWNTSRLTSTSVTTNHITQTAWDTDRQTSNASLVQTSQQTTTSWNTNSITSSSTSTTKQTNSNTVTTWNTSTGSGSTWDTTVVTSSNTTTTWATSD